MVDLADPAVVDHLLGERDGRCAAVIMIHIVQNTRLLGRVVHFLGLGVTQRDRFFTEDLLAISGSLDHNLLVQIGRGADVDDVDIRAFDDLFPIGRCFFPAPVLGKLAGSLLILSTGHLQNRVQTERKELRSRCPGIAVRFAHELGSNDCHIYVFQGIISFV